MRSLLILLCLAGPVLAAEPESGDGDIPVQEWRDLALGRTLTYTVDGAFFALERYAPAGDRVALQFRDGTCYSGTWSHVQNLYCFAWNGAEDVCFRHVRFGDDILILHVEDGVETGQMQMMTQVTDAPLECGQQVS